MSFTHFPISSLQDDVTGDGTTTTVLMCGELLRQAERYTSEGLHPRAVTDGYDIARDAALVFLDSFKVPIKNDSSLGAKYDRELMTCIASTSLRTKLDHELADGITEAIVDAILCVAPEDDKPVDLNMIEVMAMMKKMGTDSRFVNGLVLDHGGRHPDMPKVLMNCHIMTCNVTFEYEKTEVQSGFFYSNAEEREKLVESERKWLDERCKAVIDFKKAVCKEGEVSIATFIYVIERAWSSRIKDSHFIFHFFRASS
jgi:T-complex protein 1 subunit zeta